MSLKICVLGSGSNGNCTVIWTAASAILVDCGGLGADYIAANLKKIRVPFSKIKGILITHGHRDHLDKESGLAIAASNKIPIYIHKKTISKFRNHINLANFYKRRLIKHHTLSSFRIGDFMIKPFEVFHDSGYAGKPFGFCISYKYHSEKYKVGYITDTGKIDTKIIGFLKNCCATVIEANYDERLLEKSDRFNKRWVGSDTGHLNNLDTGKAIVEIKKTSASHNALRHVFLAHISEEHNKVKRALAQVKRVLSENGIKNVRLLPTHHWKISNIVNVAR